MTEKREKQFLSTAVSLFCYIFTPFLSHLPRSMRIMNIMPRKHSSVAIAIQYPRSPIIGTRMIPRVILTPHIEARFITLGIKVSPAPRMAPEHTIEAA